MTINRENNPQPVETSLKYIAWNIKEMSANVQKITSLFEELISKSLNPFKGSSEILE